MGLRVQDVESLDDCIEQEGICRAPNRQLTDNPREKCAWSKHETRVGSSALP
jgi:hypothetical protein